MAKPDLQAVYVDPNDSTLRRLKGKLGLGVALDNLVSAANDGVAAGLGVPVGGLYHTSGAVKVRLS